LITSRDNIRSARYEIKVGGRKAKHIDSGLLVSTGSGSTAWIYTASRLLPEEVGKIVKKMGKALSPKKIKELTRKVNDEHVFGPKEKKLRYFSRAIIESRIASRNLTTGYAKSLKVRSKMLDGTLVIDAKHRHAFTYGRTAIIRVAKKPLVAVM
jgi:hypothetical protein